MIELGAKLEECDVDTSAPMPAPSPKDSQFYTVEISRQNLYNNWISLRKNLATINWYPIIVGHHEELAKIADY